MLEASLATKRLRGRPRHAVPALPVSVRLPPDLHDDLIRLAGVRRQPLTAVIRRALKRELTYLKKSDSGDLPSS